MGGNKVQNVGDATEATDAINKGQFDRAINNIGTGMNEMNNRIGNLDRRVDRVGAGAAALAALHPLEFSPEAKWDISAGIGNYRGASAVAIGAFYRPNVNTLVSIGSSYGGGENMINAGVTFRIGDGETINYPSKKVMAQKITDLESVVSQQNDKIEAQSEQLNEQNKKIEELMGGCSSLNEISRRKIFNGINKPSELLSCGEPRFLFVKEIKPNGLNPRVITVMQCTIRFGYEFSKMHY